MKCPPLLPPLLVALTLTACAGKPQKVKPVTPVPPIKTLGPSTSEKQGVASYPPGSIKRRILALANNEWEYFGKQLVVYREEEESIPHVGIWEDDDHAHSNRVNQYWRAAYMPGLNGEDCQQPWSAAFVSWVMTTAGVSEELFPPATAHWVYLSRFITRTNHSDPIFVARTITEYSPRPGDLICANRDSHAYFFTGELPPAFQLTNTKLHCDIVVEKDDRTLYAIGGNVRNSVSKSAVKLTSEGFLQPSRNRQWFLVIENRLH